MFGGVDERTLPDEGEANVVSAHLDARFDLGDRLVDGVERSEGVRDPIRIASTTVGAESTGIFDVSEMVGYLPGSIMITNNQGSPASMSVLINPDATRAAPVNLPGMPWVGRVLQALLLIASSGIALTRRQ